MTAKSRCVPPHSHAFKALQRLYQVGGSLPKAAWIAACGWHKATHTFDQAVLEPLMRARLVALVGDGAGDFKLTDDGLDHLGIAMCAPAMPPLQIAGPRSAPEKRALSSAHFTRVPLMREGATDYRNIPSRVGVHSLPYVAKS